MIFLFNPHDLSLIHISDAMYAVAPINRNITLLGWKPSISLKEGIRILHEDMKDRKSTV